MFRIATIALAALTIVFAGAVHCAADDAQSKPYLKAQPEDLQWWLDARFGLFVHWGPVSLVGTEISWSLVYPPKETGIIPADEYDRLYQRFNPTKYNARQWVQIAKDAGMRYIVLTTRHHDGFSMFDSAVTDYKITKSPYGKDIVKELADACHKAGMRLGFYYSPPDWHHPDYDKHQYEFVHDYFHPQVIELCKNYGKVDILWWDGLGRSAREWDSEALFKIIRQLQPHIIINDRLGLPADFGTPEGVVGEFNLTHHWESCIPLCNQWSWKPDAKMSSLKDCIGMLVGCAGGDGNLLLNVGPMPTGEIEPRQVEVLRGIGRWLTKTGESIYGTRGGPFRPFERPDGTQIYSTRKDKNIYVHILSWQGDAVELPAVDSEIAASSVLTGGTATVKRTDEGVVIDVPAADRQDVDTIVVLKLSGSALQTHETYQTPISAGRQARASSVFTYGDDHTSWVAAKAVDGNLGSDWRSKKSDGPEWLEVDLCEPLPIDHARILADGRSNAFELQCRRAGEWVTLARGSKLAADLRFRFEPVAAQVFRLSFAGPGEASVRELQLFSHK